MKSANQKSMHCHGQSVGSAAGFLTDLFVGGEVSTSMRCFARAVVSVGLFVNFVAHNGTGRGPAHVKR